jgi:hypothetical protein
MPRLTVDRHTGFAFRFFRRRRTMHRLAIRHQSGQLLLLPSVILHVFLSSVQKRSEPEIELHGTGRRFGWKTGKERCSIAYRLNHFYCASDFPPLTMPRGSLLASVFQSCQRRNAAQIGKQPRLCKKHNP